MVNFILAALGTTARIIFESSFQLYLPRFLACDVTTLFPCQKALLRCHDCYRCIKTQRCTCWLQRKEWIFPHLIPNVQQQNGLADEFHSLSHREGLPKHYSFSQEGSFPLSPLILTIQDLLFASLGSRTLDLTLST